MIKHRPLLRQLLSYAAVIVLFLAEVVLSWSSNRVYRSSSSLFLSAPGDANDDIRLHELTLESGKAASIRSRLVPITPTWNITIWEWNKPSRVMEHYWSSQQHFSSRHDLLDPFGLVSWPGSVVAGREMLKYRAQIQDSSVLVLGGGPGVEAQAVAMLGAKKVIATDIHPTTLQLLRYGAHEAGLDKVIQVQGV